MRDVELGIEQHVHRHGNVTAAPTREQFEDLASELETVWSCSEKDVRLRKRILRTLLHEIVVDVDAEAGEIILTLHWKGGVHTELRLPRRRRGQNSSQTIAGVLNRNGLQTGRGNRWTRERTRARREHPVLRQQASIGSSKM